MSFFLGADSLKLHRLAGSNIVEHAPIFSPAGDLLFLISENIIHVYSTTTGLHVREFTDSSKKIICMELDLFDDNILITCNENGELVYWNWSTGQIKRKISLQIYNVSKITSFNQLNLCGDSESANVLLLCETKGGKYQWFVFETSHGKRVKVPCNLALNEKPALVAVNTKKFKNICIAQDCRIYFINYKTWKWIGLTNGLKVPITCVKWHPAEEMVATGDKIGRIFLWRNFWNTATVITRLYHWHATPVTSIAFTQSGSGFYSSGLEAVVVIWNTSREELRNFVAHITCAVCHIAVSQANLQVAISTLDNGVQILGNDNVFKCNVQEFTYILEDGTGKSRFPVGLQMNPRSNSLVLNGRVGHLQFYSAHTRSLLYNVDIVGQNQLTSEPNKILYNIQVVKAAFNIDWMATGEVFNDQEHFPELRLKFWKYLEKSQSYKLNTSIDLPHEGGFKAIEFSNANQVENLLCVTVGVDNVIKIWALDDSDSIYKKFKVWFCIAQANYKKLPIESVSFSHDGSLLAAGCGNTLCIFKSDSLKLKVALNTSPGFDGSISKVELRLPAQKRHPSNESVSKERNNILQLFLNAIENNEDELLKKIKQKKSKDGIKTRLKISAHCVDNKDKSALFKRIMNTHQLNLFQQILILQRLGVQCKVSPSWHDKMLSYIQETIHRADLVERIDNLNERIRRLNVRYRFKAKYRLHQYIQRSRKLKKSSVDNLASILSVLGLKEKKQLNGKIENVVQKMDIDNDETNCDTTSENVELWNTTSSITHVQFASNEFGHLVIVCTKNRILVWNLLTLRLENVLKLSTEHLAFDPLTNLVAVFTKNNELHIFQPNVPMPIYQHVNLPKIHGAVWIPCPNPKSSSVHVDWQSQSQLYFFTESQEIMYLHDPRREHLVHHPSVTFKNPNDTVGLQYSTFGTFATKQISDKQSNKLQRSGPLIVGSAGKTAVKVLIEMSTHTMPPISLVCSDFLKSLIKPVDATSTLSNAALMSDVDRKQINGAINGSLNGDYKHESSEDEFENEDDEVFPGTIQNGGVEYAKTENNAKKLSIEAYRKNIAAKTEAIKALHEKNKTKEQNEKPNIESQLKKIAAFNLDLEF